MGHHDFGIIYFLQFSVLLNEIRNMCSVQSCHPLRDMWKNLLFTGAVKDTLTSKLFFFSPRKPTNDQHGGSNETFSFEFQVVRWVWSTHRTGGISTSRVSRQSGPPSDTWINRIQTQGYALFLV